MGPEPKAKRINTHLNIQRMGLQDVEPAGYNPREIEPDARTNLGRGIDYFGLVEPLVVNKRSEEKGWSAGEKPTLVGGHQRYRYLVENGAMSADFSVVDLDEADEKALNLLLNNPEAQGHYLKPRVSEILQQLDSLGGKERMQATGFTRTSLLELLNQEREPGPPGRRSPPEHECPSCGQRFTPSLQTAVKK